MSAVRRHLGVLTTIWLLCQALSLSALVPRLCCPDHSRQDESGADCLRVAPSEYCPMTGVDGQPCPEHAGAGLPQGDSQCTIRGTCDAPAVALASLFSAPGVLVDAAGIVIDDVSSPVPASARRPTAPVVIHDTPPPRL